MHARNSDGLCCGFFDNSCNGICKCCCKGASSTFSLHKTMYNRTCSRVLLIEHRDYGRLELHLTEQHLTRDIARFISKVQPDVGSDDDVPEEEDLENGSPKEEEEVLPPRSIEVQTDFSYSDDWAHTLDGQYVPSGAIATTIKIGDSGEVGRRYKRATPIEIGSDDIGPRPVFGAATLPMPKFKDMGGMFSWGSSPKEDKPKRKEKEPEKDIIKVEEGEVEKEEGKEEEGEEEKGPQSWSSWLLSWILWLILLPFTLLYWMYSVCYSGLSSCFSLFQGEDEKDPVNEPNTGRGKRQRS